MVGGTAWYIAIAGVVATTVGCASPKVNPWSQVALPAPGVAHAIGTYSSGCLTGGHPVKVDDGPIQLMRPSRRRNYAHPVMVRFLKNYALALSRGQLGAVIVGDIAQARGGPFLTGHKSHQTGLDVDLWFDQIDSHEGKFTELERENLQPRPLAVSGGLNSELWGEKIAKRLELAARTPEVERIFVNAAIKRALCVLPLGAKRSNDSWMSKVRPWWGHDYHFHVRLLCPKADTECANPSDPIPPGNGCDETLDWWFTEEARLKGLAPETQPGADPELVPEACGAVLNAPAAPIPEVDAEPSSDLPASTDS